MANKLSDSNGIFAVSKEQAKTLAKQLGINIPDTAKAFHNPLEGYTVLIKDNITNTDNIDNILAHEIGVHANLKTTLGDKLYNDVMDFVGKNIEKPEGKWAEAIGRSQRWQRGSPWTLDWAFWPEWPIVQTDWKQMVSISRLIKIEHQNPYDRDWSKRLH